MQERGRKREGQGRNGNGRGLRSKTTVEERVCEGRRKLERWDREDVEGGEEGDRRTEPE